MNGQPYTFRMIVHRIKYRTCYANISHCLRWRSVVHRCTYSANLNIYGYSKVANDYKWEFPKKAKINLGTWLVCGHKYWIPALLFSVITSYTPHTSHTMTSFFNPYDTITRSFVRQLRDTYEQMYGVSQVAEYGEIIGWVGNMAMVSSSSTVVEFKKI